MSLTVAADTQLRMTERSQRRLMWTSSTNQAATIIGQYIRGTVYIVPTNGVFYDQKEELSIFVNLDGLLQFLCHHPVYKDSNP